MSIKKKELFVLFVIILIAFSILLKVVHNFPFLILDKNSLEYKDEQGWVRYIKTTGRFATKKIEFNYNNKTVILVCGDKIVSSANCNLAKYLDEKIIIGKSYTNWEKINLKISKLDIPIINFLCNCYLLKE